TLAIETSPRRRRLWRSGKSPLGPCKPTSRNARRRSHRLKRSGRHAKPAWARNWTDGSRGPDPKAARRIVCWPARRRRRSNSRCSKPPCGLAWNNCGAPRRRWTREESARTRESDLTDQDADLKEKLSNVAKAAASLDDRRAELAKRESDQKALTSELEKREVGLDKITQTLVKHRADLNRAEKELAKSQDGIALEVRGIAGQRKAAEHAQAELDKRTKELESQTAAAALREREAADLKSRATSFLRSAEK